MNRTDEIKNLRTRLASLQREQSELTAQIRSRAEVGEHVKRVIAQWESEAARACRRTLTALAYGYAPILEADVIDGHAAAPSTAVLGPALVTIVGATKLASALTAHLDAVPAGLPAAERTARLEAIAAEIDDIEVREEALICEAEAAGEYPLRRADARPEIVLALADV